MNSQNYNLQAVPTATAARLGAKPVRLVAVYLLAGSDATSVQFKNAATDTGTALFTMNCAAGTGQYVDMSKHGGISFDVGCFVKPVGTGAIAYCWYE